MGKSYDYVLAVWLALDVESDTTAFQDELREYLEEEYQIVKLEIIEQSEDVENEITISLQLQLTFAQSHMDGHEPTEEAVEESDRELRSYLEAKYRLNYMEILDDSLTSYLLAEREDD